MVHMLFYCYFIILFILIFKFNKSKRLHSIQNSSFLLIRTEKLNSTVNFIFKKLFHSLSLPIKQKLKTVMLQHISLPLLLSLFFVFLSNLITFEMNDKNKFFRFNIKQDNTALLAE